MKPTKMSKTRPVQMDTKQALEEAQEGALQNTGVAARATEIAKSVVKPMPVKKGGGHWSGR